jgi:hypothetical protein
MEIYLRGEMDRVEAAQVIQAQVPIRIVDFSAFLDASTPTRAQATNAARIARQAHHRWHTAVSPEPLLRLHAPPPNSS